MRITEKEAGSISLNKGSHRGGDKGTRLERGASEICSYQMGVLKGANRQITGQSKELKEERRRKKLLNFRAGHQKLALRNSPLTGSQGGNSLQRRNAGSSSYPHGKNTEKKDER